MTKESYRNSMYVRTPEAEQQTPLRKSWAFWIGGITRPGGEKVFGTWLARSPHNPHNDLWRGIEIDAEKGEDPMTKVARACGRLLGHMPSYVDTIDVLQPGDLPGIRHTTYVSAVAGFARRKEVGPFRPTPGLTLGLYPINELPKDNIDPSRREWLADLLNRAVAEGLSSSRIQFIDETTPYADCNSLILAEA